ncbi:MAG TPA: sulfite exporter TauE/SafE family protein, partial [Solirubrobacteraceae bacterium]|nr:sulfite exporter TauE/SafE family protein [Solirubrobacteraceae bacterium]
MTLLQALALAAAGLVAGTASAMAGGASIITFPVLLAMGVPPLAANVTNTVGLTPVAVGAALGSAPELRRQRRRLAALAPAALIGAAGGTALLLSTPGDTFGAIVPALIAGSCLLMLAQPWLVRHTLAGGGRRRRRRAVAQASTLLVGAYTGYFGAASGVMFMALVGLVSAASLHELNAVKNMLVGAANALARVIFVLVAPVRWPMAAALAVGAVIGGAAGALLARRIPAPYLRTAIALVGLAVAARLAL